MAKRGRPEIYSPELAEEICRRLSNGESLRSICRDDIMPHRDTVRKWMFSEHEEFIAHYERAREEQATHYAEEIIEIADADDIKPDDKRIRIDARKWRAARQAPKRWGDKVEIGGGFNSTVTLDASGLPPALRFLAGNGTGAEGGSDPATG